MNWVQDAKSEGSFSSPKALRHGRHRISWGEPTPLLSMVRLAAKNLGGWEAWRTCRPGTGRQTTGNVKEEEEEEEEKTRGSSHNAGGNVVFGLPGLQVRRLEGVRGQQLTAFQ